MPPEQIPIIEYFRSFVKTEDLNIFGSIGLNTDREATNLVEKIYRNRIERNDDYLQTVDSMIRQQKELLGIDITPASPAASSIGAESTVLEKISQAA
jgi:hypothetical protein